MSRKRPTADQAMRGPEPLFPARPLAAAEHALLELRRVGLRLCAALDEWVTQRGDHDSPLAHSVASCRGQLALLTGPVPGVDRPGALPPIAEELEQLAAHLAQRASAAEQAGAPTPLQRLQRDAVLSDFELEVLLLAALPEESALWGSLFAFLAGSDAVRRPSVHSVLNLLYPPSARRALLQRLVAGPLLGLQLVRLHPPDAPLADRTIVIASETWHALSGLDVVEPVLAPWLVAGEPPHTLPVLAPDAAVRVDGLVQRARAGQPVRAVLFGAQGSGRRTVARHIAAEAGGRLVEVRVPPGEPPAGWGAAAVRHALTHGAGLLCTASPGPGEATSLSLRLPEGMSCFLALPEKSDVRGDTLAEAVRVHLLAPTVRERQELWRAALARRGVEDLSPAALARRFRLSGGELGATLDTAVELSRLEGRPGPTLEDLTRSVRERPSARLESLARRRSPKARWDDLILPPNATAQLRELSDRVRHRDLVFDEWNVVSHSARQTGVLALFVGPSGTGKTLAAEVIAGELELDLYCVDLSQVVSKYIGETEKNLARVFDAVEGTAAVLFFDEADGVFGKRTDTHDARDRYANLEVSYLLARIEAFAGVAILASNLRQNIDPAFLRRMDFVVELTQPDIAARRRIWEAHLRTGAPLAADIDPARLAEVFPVSGAHIRNAVVAAAFGAAAEGTPIGIAHISAAMRREYEKVGKAFPAGLFTEEKRTCMQNP